MEAATPPSLVLEEDDTVPSKAIWDPSLQSSSGSIASSWTSDHSTVTSNTVVIDEEEEKDDGDDDDDDRVFGQTLAGARTETMATSETELRMKILHESDDHGNNNGDSNNNNNNNKNSKIDYEDHCMSAMLMSNISSLHGASGSGSGTGYSFDTDGSDSTSSGGKDGEANHKPGAKYNRPQKHHPQPMVPLTPAQLQKHERHQFINSYLSHLTDKQLKTQLWDSFRLARVVLGKPVKGKRKPLSHNALLHAIRKVAEMRIQILHMAEELDDLRQKDRLRKHHRLSFDPCTAEGTPCSLSVSSSLSTGSSHLHGTNASSAASTKSGRLSVRDLTETSASPRDKMVTLRKHAIQLLQEESDLVTEQLRELQEQLEFKKHKHNSKPKAAAAAAASDSEEFDLRDDTVENKENVGQKAKTPLFLSPSSSSDESDSSYNMATSPESAEDILYAFSGARRLAPAMMVAADTPEPPKQAGSGDADVSSSQQEEICSVLQRVVALRDEQKRSGNVNPEVTVASTTSGTSNVAAVHDQVISLLTRLASLPAQPAAKSSEATRATVIAGAQGSPVRTKSQPEAKATAIATAKKKQESPQQLTQQPKAPTLLPVVSMEVEPGPGPSPVADLEAKLIAVKKQKEKSVATLEDFSLQKKLLKEDIAKAKANRSPNRTELQLERLEDYKRQVEDLLEEEELRFQKVTDLDRELAKLAEKCVILEDAETQFRERHEHHQATLRGFRTLTQLHTKKFQTLLKTIDESIVEQRAKVFGGTNAIPKPSPRAKKDKTGKDAESHAETIRNLQYMLTKRNVELYSAQSQLAEKKKKTKKRPTRRIFIPTRFDS
mmetsp:Transcript_7960/g.23507  ORF Transcript_7960/g.23507 Transcript_7960/m.23507 type:complete len:833 (-) Transcript_7960:1140-3638(-)